MSRSKDNHRFNFTERLKHCMELTGYKNASQLAEPADVHRESIVKLLKNNNRKPEWGTLRGIIKAMPTIDPNYLLFINDYPIKPSRENIGKHNLYNINEKVWVEGIEKPGSVLIALYQPCLLGYEYFIEFSGFGAWVSEHRIKKEV